jgi:hypothetical protein
MVSSCRGTRGGASGVPAVQYIYHKGSSQLEDSPKLKKCRFRNNLLSITTDFQRNCSTDILALSIIHPVSTTLDARRL